MRVVDREDAARIALFHDYDMLADEMKRYLHVKISACLVHSIGRIRVEGGEGGSTEPS